MTTQFLAGIIIGGVFGLVGGLLFGLVLIPPIARDIMGEDDAPGTAMDTYRPVPLATREGEAGRQPAFANAGTDTDRSLPGDLHPDRARPLRGGDLAPTMDPNTATGTVDTTPVRETERNK